MASVTVIVCAYNHEAFVEEAVRSVLAQQAAFPVEVVVHDDASTDATAAILRRLECEHPGRFRLVVQAENQMSRGVVVPNQLALAATSAYVAYCDGDDSWTDDRKLERQVAFMEANPWCAISHHGVEVVNEGGSPEYAAALAELLAVPGREQPRVPGLAIADGNYLLTSSVMVRRSALRDEVLRACVDVQPDDFVLYALACEQGDIGYLPERMARYRLHPDNSWASMAPAERHARLIDAYWFLGAHLRGPLQAAIRSRLVALELARGERSPLPSVAALEPIRERLHEADAERRRLRRAEQDLAIVRGSTSWRITAPMRRLRDLL